jgi:hypothetical protein
MYSSGSRYLQTHGYQRFAMLAPARHSNANTFAYSAFDSAEDYASGDLYSGERICPPRAGSGGNAVLRAYVVIFIALGGGWALLGNQANWQGWLSAKIAAMSPAPIEPTGSTAAPVVPQANIETAVKQPAIEPPPSILRPLDSRDIAAAPGDAASPPAPPLTTAATAHATDEPATAPLPPPTPDPSDPYQMRASAVGLHPDLSRVLLTRLSPTDYRNAGIAIQTAVAKTPDREVFVWPRQRKPELALFQVHFVPGAAVGCRRYVVTVTKDGWSTTALPMEKCGLKVTGRSTG